HLLGQQDELTPKKHIYSINSTLTSCNTSMIVSAGMVHTLTVQNAAGFRKLPDYSLRSFSHQKSV
ncbi:MAG: hypothetical protein QME13_08405, partial [Thermoanaerobacteraceae bacterium]|nr:hypothetical protein [Thermoanaerobacteraceae bacterium]